MWARVHKVDRIRPQPGGGAVVLVEDERGAAQMQRVASLSILIAVARVLNARRVLETRYAGKGEVRYVTRARVPSALADAIARAGASIGDGERAVVPAQPSGIAAVIDVAFTELAHHVRGSIGIVDLRKALDQTEQGRRAAPLDRDAHTERYWPAVLELAALAGELARARGARWVETTDVPLPFALKLPDGAMARPTDVAVKIVEGTAAESLAEPA